MRPGPIFPPVGVWRRVIGQCFGHLRRISAWRRRGLVRPLSVTLGLVLIFGGLTTARSLLDSRELVAGSARDGWPTAVASGRAEPAFGAALALPFAGEPMREDELAAALARLKEGAFGVTFAAKPDPAGKLAVNALAPIVLIDADQPPLRIDIMGLLALGGGPSFGSTSRVPKP